MNPVRTNAGVSLHSLCARGPAHTLVVHRVTLGVGRQCFHSVHFPVHAVQTPFNAVHTSFRPSATLYRALSGNHSEIPQHHRPAMSHSVVTNQSHFLGQGSKKTNAYVFRQLVPMYTTQCPLCALPRQLITPIQTHVRPCNPLRIGLIMVAIKRSV